MLEKIIEDYNNALFDTDRARAHEVVQNALKNGVTPEDIVFKVVSSVLHQSVQVMGKQDINLAQHYLTAQIAVEITDAMIPKFKKKPKIEGTVVIGTAAGDLHSLGKRIVAGCLKSLMIEVIDLGVNVSAEEFIEAAIKHDAQIIGVSAMMVHTASGGNGAKKVRQLMKEKGLEDRIRLVVGGAPYHFDADLYKNVGADSWAEDGIRAANIIANLIKEVKK